MLYAVLKAAHLLAIVAWVGGRFFMLYCLRPALPLLEAPMRLRLVHAVLRRFFGIVTVAAALVLMTGGAMLMLAAGSTRRAGLGFNMPLDWQAMVALGLVMVAIFGHVRWVLFRRLRRAVEAGNWPAGGAALNDIRGWVEVNLVLGVIIVVVTRLGQAT